MNKVDFLPEDYIEKKAQQRTNVICLLLFLAVMAGVGGGFAITEKRKKGMDDRIAQVNKQMKQASESLKQLEVLEGKREQMMNKASLSASLMESVPRSLILATVTNDLPAGVSLTEFELSSKDITPQPEVQKKKTSKSRSKNTKSKSAKEDADPENTKIIPQKWQTVVEVTGLAPTDIQVAELIENLQASKLIKEANLMYSEEQETEDENVRHFQLLLTLDPEARASEEDVEMARSIGVKGM